MKKRNLLMTIGAIFMMGYGLLASETTPVSAQTFENISERGINADKSAPTGDPNVSYPQISIRTNRTPERTNLNEVVKRANSAAEQYPIEDKENRSKAVLKELTEYFGSGSLGHAWIIIFNSNKPGDCTTYGYHEGYGFVKNGTAGDQNDRPDRKFNVVRTLPLDPNKQPEELEKTIIPALNQESAYTAQLMGLPVANPLNGAYTPINNCSWFAGKLWNYVTEDGLNFEQDFDGAEHADYWGMPVLNAIKTIADPGMIAESISK